MSFGVVAIGASLLVPSSPGWAHLARVEDSTHAAGFGFYEPLFRKGGTDDVDLNFQIYILGTATPTTRAPARSSPTPARSRQAQGHSGRASATPPSSAPAASAASASAPTVIAASTAGPAPHVTAALDKAQRSGFTAGWAAGTSGVAVIGVVALVAAVLRRRRRTEPAPPSAADED